jgi:hypothetical protein
MVHKLYRLFGLQPQERPITYEEFMDFVWPEDRDKTRAVVERDCTIASRSVASTESRYEAAAPGSRTIAEKSYLTMTR